MSLAESGAFEAMGWDSGPDYPFDDDPTPRRWPKPSGDMEGVSFGQTTAAERIRREGNKPRVHLTEGQRFRAERDLIILLCHEVGLSNRLIANVFGMARARVNEIVEQQRATHCDRAQTASMIQS
jgi:hypothetical protein